MLSTPELAKAYPSALVRSHRSRGSLTRIVVAQAVRFERDVLVRLTKEFSTAAADDRGEIAT